MISNDSNNNWKRLSMEKDFWLSKWQANEIGFHLKDYHPLLQKYFPMLYSNEEAVFVPLCGKTRDMAFFESKGVKVLGCELSELAAQQFFEELYPISEDKVLPSQQGLFSKYQKNGITILVGNIFDLMPSDLQQTSFIYDRASIIALPSKLREAYVSHLKAVFPTARMLLITLDYDQGVMSGPPFSVHQEEINQLYSFATVKQLYRNNIIDQEPKFQSKGLKEFYETAYSIEW